MEFDYSAFILFLLYLIVLFLSIFQILEILNSNYKKVTIRNGVMTFISFGSFLRIIIWIKVMIQSTISKQLVMLIYFFPVWVNFAAISLLVLFYVDTLYPGVSNRLFFIIWIVLNFTFLCLNVSLSLLIDDPNTSTKDKSIVNVFYVSYGIVIDLIISIFLGYFGYQFVKQNSNQSKIKRWLLPRSVAVFSSVNWIIVICYATRGFFILLFALKTFDNSSYDEVELNGKHSPTSFVVVFFFLITEIIPNISILYLLWRPKENNHNKLSKHKSGSFDYLEEFPCNISESDLIDNLLTKKPSIEDSKISIHIFPDIIDETGREPSYEPDLYGQSPSDSSESSDLLIKRNPLSNHFAATSAAGSIRGLHVNSSIAKRYNQNNSNSHSNLSQIGEVTESNPEAYSRHLNPSIVFGESDGDSDDFQLEERYSDALGPRDILMSHSSSTHHPHPSK